VPPSQDFKQKVRAKAYRVIERAGLVWAYMGAQAKAPPMPALETLLVPEAEIGVTCIQRDCNYLQALEGDIDTSHFGFLHAGHIDPDELIQWCRDGLASFKRPRAVVELTELPKTATGKIRRNVLREMARADLPTGSPVAPS